jgi:hypothetical protein
VYICAHRQAYEQKQEKINHQQSICIQMVPSRQSI